jgi:hypothetical protein
MSEMAKPSAVYVSPARRFVTVRSVDDLSTLSQDAVASPPGSEELFLDRPEASRTFATARQPNAQP